MLVNSPVPNWKPQSIRCHQNRAIIGQNKLIAPPGPVVEIDADLAVVKDLERSGPGRAIVGVGVAIGSIGRIMRLGPIEKFQHLTVQQIVHLGRVQHLIGGPNAILGKSRTGEKDQEKKNAHGLSVAREKERHQSRLGQGCARPRLSTDKTSFRSPTAPDSVACKIARLWKGGACLKIPMICAALLWPALGLAEDIAVTDAFVPMPPKGAMAHAAYMGLTNTGETTRSIVGVSASNYAVALLHQSLVKDGIATMTSIDQLDINPGQTLILEPGGLHVMLMKPADPIAFGDTVTFDLQFENGETISVTANVVPRDGSS